MYNLAVRQNFLTCRRQQRVMLWLKDYQVILSIILVRKREVDVNDKSLVFTNINGKYYAMDSVCSHEGGPLEEGTLEEYTLICP